MFYSDKEIKSRLNSEDNLANRLELHKIERGRRESVETPMEIRKVVSILSNEGEKTNELAQEFGISKESVNSYKAGQTSRNRNTRNEELMEVVDRVKSARSLAEEAAINKVMVSIGLLDNDKLAKNLKAKDIASIAKDMAVVADKMSGRNKGDMGNGNLHVHLYAPPVNKVEDYDVIDV